MVQYLQAADIFVLRQLAEGLSERACWKRSRAAGGDRHRRPAPAREWWTDRVSGLNIPPDYDRAC